MLEVEDLKVGIGGRVILEHIDLKIHPGETHVLFGPNGSGKTSLLMTIMGYPQFEVLAGRILFKGEDITRAPIDQRAKMGIGMSYQRPPTIHGLKLRQMVGICSEGRVEAGELAGRMGLEALLDRDINAGYSGGEIKRSELLQLMAQGPDLMLFDEPESGVDVESIALVGGTIAALLQRDESSGGERSIRRMRRERRRMGLIITHTGYILDHVRADWGQVLFKGELACANRPDEIFRCIQRYGYEECVRCTNERS